MWANPELPASPQFNSPSRSPPPKKDPPFTYSGANLNAIDFPVGGFGAGNVKISGDGTLQNYSNVNQPNASTVHMPNNFWGISAAPANSPTKTQSFVLASPETFTNHTCNLPSHEPASVSRAAVKRLQTLPGIKSFTLTGTYPTANLDYDITDFPLQVSMEAMSPCIPQDVKNSSLPCGYFTFTITNPTTTTHTVRLLQSQQNFIGWDGTSDCSSNSNPKWGGNVNTAMNTNEYTSMNMSNPTTPDGTMSLAGVHNNESVATMTVIPAATDSSAMWTLFCNNKDVLPTKASPSEPSQPTFSTCCGIVQSTSIPPNTSVTLTFILTWNFPNRLRDTLGLGQQYATILPSLLGNRYCDWFKNSDDVLAYCVENMGMLLSTTKLYTGTMYASTIPPELLDSASGRVACMRSATMWWTNAACSLKYGTQGTIMGTEGNGCCPLNCTHVYGYTTLMERLWPTLAQDMRCSDFIRNFDMSQKGCTMRFGTGGWAIDGALANVIKTYIVVRQSDGDDLSFLKSVWPNVVLQMNYIQTNFDAGDGVLRKPQQNTYDTAMSGANTFIGSYYVTALRAMSKMSGLMQEDPSKASEYLAQANKASNNYEKICWNEEFGYYVADVDLSNCQNSYGPGCFVDQLCCVGLSSACGLGHVFNPDHEDQAHRALLANNFVVKPPFEDLQKHFYNGDIGLVVCTYPNGKLGDGMMYETIVSTGFTSPNIAGMLLDRNVIGARTTALHIRNRYDGRNASPWNEPECDLLYSRSMAHWNIFDQACGIIYDSTSGSLSFDPRINQSKFNCFCTLNGGWGEFSQTGILGEEEQNFVLMGTEKVQTNKKHVVALASGHATLKCLWGSFSVNSLGLKTTGITATATVNGASVDIASFIGGVVTFFAAVVLHVNDVLIVSVDGGKEGVDTRLTVEGCGVGGGRTDCCSGSDDACHPNETTKSHGHGHGHGHGVQSPPASLSSCCGVSCGPDSDCNKQGVEAYNDDFDVKSKATTTTPSFSGMNILQILLVFLCGMVSSFFIQQGIRWSIYMYETN